jgi:adenosine deaminase
VAVDRSQSLQEATENIDLAIEFYNSNNSNNNKTDEIPPPRVVGVDLGGNPTKQDFQMFAPLFSKARRAGLKVTLHCGEVPCVNDLKNHVKDDANIRQEGAAVAQYDEAVAILDFKPDRLGHAMLLPPNLQARIVQERIPVETCPTSNVMTLELTNKNKAVIARHHDNDNSNDNGGDGDEIGSHNNNYDNGNLIAGLRHHPTLKLWLQQEHPLCISTDDPGVFCTSLTQELLLVATTFQIAKEQLAEIVVFSMQHAFCDSDTKSRIQKRMQQQLDQLHGQQ